MHMPEHIQTDCPLCGDKDKQAIKWLADCSGNNDYNPAFNPRREWWYCPDCHHVYARNYPEDLYKAVTSHVDPQYMQPNPKRFALYSDTLNNIRTFAYNEFDGSDILDVGFGAGEFLLTAHEMGCECYGVDLRCQYVNNLARLLPEAHVECGGLNAASAWMPFDVISMGDVLEHDSHPDLMLGGVNAMLRRNGILYISTPNFDSAFTRVVGEQDWMRGVCEHINWFSRKSLFETLKRTGFEPIHYSVSRHFNGCMEVIARKV